MSEEGDRIRAALTGEWQSTAEIAEKAGLERLTWYNRMCKVNLTLNSDVRFGLVEKRRLNGHRAGTMNQWRRAA